MKSELIQADVERFSPQLLGIAVGEKVYIADWIDLIAAIPPGADAGSVTYAVFLGFDDDPDADDLFAKLEFAGGEVDYVLASHLYRTALTAAASAFGVMLDGHGMLNGEWLKDPVDEDDADTIRCAVYRAATIFDSAYLEVPRHQKLGQLRRGKIGMFKDEVAREIASIRLREAAQQ